MTFKNSVSPATSDTSLNKGLLKLRAENSEDLTLISTFLQDALVPFISMTHDPKTQVFSLLTHRFRWEKSPVSQDGSTLYERINALLNIHHVKNFQKKGLKNPHNPNQTLNLLCVTSEDNTIILTFSNNIQVQLSVEKMLVLLGDQNISWPTPHKPSHS